VLTFARGVEGERGEVSVRNLLQEVARFVEETFPRNIKVQVLVPREPGRVSGDLTQLHQVLLNLALNARDAMPEGGTLTLRAEPVEVGEAHVRRLPALKPGPHVLLSVTDTGSGIPPEALDRIFDPFFTTKPRGKGTGLGLSTVHGLVRSHGGAVEVTTEMDAGTTFTVYLPSLLAPAAVESRQSLSPFGGGAGRRVLVVDDEPAILDIVGVLLAQHGFEVRVARDGAEGLAVFESGGPWDLAIVDRMMPQLDGMALAAAMRLADARLPIVIMSGLMHEPVSSEGIGPTLAELGIDVVLEKPFGEADLVGALKRALPAAKR
jgi:CheY-like chemotaxis protein